MMKEIQADGNTTVIRVTSATKSKMGVRHARKGQEIKMRDKADFILTSVQGSRDQPGSTHSFLYILHPQKDWFVLYLFDFLSRIFLQPSSLKSSFAQILPTSEAHPTCGQRAVCPRSTHSLLVREQRYINSVQPQHKDMHTQRRFLGHAPSFSVLSFSLVLSHPLFVPQPIPTCANASLFVFRTKCSVVRLFCLSTILFSLLPCFAIL